MKKFLFTALVLACTTAYATNNGNDNGPKGSTTSSEANSNSTSGAVAGSHSTAGANSNSLSGATATGGQAVAGSSATGGTSTSGVTATVGQSLSGATATTGASTSNAVGGNATGGQGGQGGAGGEGGRSNSTSLGVGGQGGNSSSTSLGVGGQGGTSGSNSKATGGQGGNSSSTSGSSNAVAGSSNASAGSASSVASPSVTSNISIGESTPERIQADKEIAAGHDQAARDVANSKIRNTPSMFGPALTSSNDTCMGSTSGSVATPGFGISIGTTWSDDNCKMLKNSRELWNMGFKAAAMALMCNDPLNKEALESTGYLCPVKKEKTN